MKREELIEKFNEALENKNDICVAVTIPNQNELEYIINKYNSIKNKLDYYCKAYDENCVHCMNDKIIIKEVFSIDFYIGE